MQNIKNFGLIFFLTLILMGCATTQSYQCVLNHWQGQCVQKLVHVWGAPDGAVKMPSGSTVYMYTKRQLFTRPLIFTPNTNVMTIGGTPITANGFNGGLFGETINLYCRTWFEINPQGIIVSSQFQGSNCVASSLYGLAP